MKNIQRIRVGGRVYFYHRKTRTRLPDDVNSPAFRDAWEAEERKCQPASADKPGTLGALITRYRASPEFAALAGKTKADYLRYLDGFAPLAQVAVSAIDTPYVMRIRDKAAKRGWRHANYALSVLSRLFTWGKPYGFTNTNPVQDVPKLRRPKGVEKRNRRWTPAEIDFVLAAAPTGLRVAILIGLQGQCRLADVIAMTRGSWDGTELEVRQKKTGKLTRVPAHGRLAAELARLPDGQLHLVVGERGLPYAGTDGFKANFFRLIRELEAHECVPPGLTFHGLRHTAGTTLAEAGATASQISAVLGCTLQAAEVYVRDADRPRLAREAAALRERPANGSL